MLHKFYHVGLDYGPHQSNGNNLLGSFGQALIPWWLIG
jgi:hypothetical protein